MATDWVGLTSANYELLNKSRRFTPVRFKIKKADGRLYTHDVNNDKTFSTGDLGGDPAEAKIIQVIHDTFGFRNRTYVLYQVPLGIVTYPVVAMIDHANLDNIVEINSVTCTGWPAASGTAHNMYLDEARNLLYIAPATIGPLVQPSIIEVDMNNIGDTLVSCEGLSEADSFLNVRWFETTHDQTGHDGFLAICGVYNDKLWAFFNYTGADYRAVTAHKQAFGYFDLTTLAFNVLWKIGAGPGDDGWAWQHGYSTGIYNLKAWDFDKESHTVTFAFVPRAWEISYGYESAILEIDLDLQRDMSDIGLHIVGELWNFNDSSFQVLFMAQPPPIPGFPSMNAEPTYDPDTDTYYWPACGYFSGETSFDELALFEGPVQIVLYPSGAVNDPTLYIQSSVWGSQAARTSAVFDLDPTVTDFDFLYGNYLTDDSSASSGTKYIRIGARQAIPGMISYRSCLDPSSLSIDPGAHRPTTEDSPGSCSGVKRAKDLSNTAAAIVVDVVRLDDCYILAMEDFSGTPIGFWRVQKDGYGVTKYTTANSDLYSNYVRSITKVGQYAVLIASGKGSSPDTISGKIQYFDASADVCAFQGSAITYEPSGQRQIEDVVVTGDWMIVCNKTNVTILIPSTTSSEWDRSIRKWWDGTLYDKIIGDNTASINDKGVPQAIQSFAFSQSKGEGSITLDLSLIGQEYLPWAESPFNENEGAPGTYEGVFADPNVIIMERGIIQENGQITWVPECQAFVVNTPTAISAGIPYITVNCKGVIGALLTRAVYEYTHKPTEQVVSEAALTTTNDLLYYYVVGGGQIYDWAEVPEPIIYVDGVAATAYTINTANGEVTFYVAQTGKTITASFTYYVAGTNEPEDIIKCILKHPNEVGGADLDETYFTENVLGETPSTTDNTTYTFEKNNVRENDAYNVVYLNGVKIYYWTLVAGTWVLTNTLNITYNHKLGTIVFTAPQTGVVTVNYTYYTIQRAGVTLRTIALTPKTQQNAYDAINEVCRRVAPNYICLENREGKIVCDYFTQMPEGSEHLEIDDSDIVLTAFSDNPIWYGFANYIISYGQAPLSELPNLCYGSSVTDLWPHGWHAGTNMQTIVDGDAATQITGGYGRWGEGTYSVQTALIAAGEDGTDMFKIDLGAIYEAGTIIIARGSQVATEGDAGAVCTFSIHVSADNTTWERIINATTLGPGQNLTFKAGTNFKESQSFRYLKVACHSLGLYQWKGHTDSQIGFSEVQIFESDIIEGIAVMQNDSVDDDYFDYWDILKKYGYLVYVARNGQPDPALYTTAKVQADAEATLEEMIRLLAQIDCCAKFLPAIPIFSTIKITNGVLGRSKTFFVESRAIDNTGDTFTGTTRP